MDTGLVEGYIFLAEVLYMFGEERQHVRLAVIGLFAERLVRQRADAAVALQGALADLEQHAQVLVVEKPDPVHRVRGFAGRLHGEQHLVLTVEPFHHLLHPVLEIVAGKQFHVLRPPSFGYAARAQRVVAFQLFRCRGFARDGAVFEQAVYFRLPVAALAAQHDIGDALFAAHALEGAATHVQQVRRLAGGEQPVGGFFLPTAGNGTHVCRSLGYLFRQCGEGGTFHRYHFHIQSFLLVYLHEHRLRLGIPFKRA